MKIFYGNTARLVKEAGDSEFAKMCGIIVVDEGCYEIVY